MATSLNIGAPTAAVPSLRFCAYRATRTDLAAHGPQPALARSPSVMRVEGDIAVLVVSVSVHRVGSTRTDLAARELRLVVATSPNVGRVECGVAVLVVLAV